MQQSDGRLARCERACDALRPDADRVPVAVVALRRLDASDDHALRKRQLVTIERAAKDAVPARPDGRVELGDRSQRCRIGGCRLAGRPTAEEPHGTLGQSRAVAPHEIDSLMHPGPEIDGTADDDGLVLLEVPGRLHRLDLYLQPPLPQSRGDTLCDPGGCSVLAGIGNEYRHLRLPSDTGPLRLRLPWRSAAPASRRVNPQPPHDGVS